MRGRLVRGSFPIRAIGIVSIHNMPIFDAITRDGTISVIDCRHEMAATHAADGGEHHQGPSRAKSFAWIVIAYVVAIALPFLLFPRDQRRLTFGFAALGVRTRIIGVAAVSRGENRRDREVVHLHFSLRRIVAARKF